MKTERDRDLYCLLQVGYQTKKEIDSRLSKEIE